MELPLKLLICVFRNGYYYDCHSNNKGIETIVYVTSGISLDSKRRKRTCFNSIEGLFPCRIQNEALIDPEDDLARYCICPFPVFNGMSLVGSACSSSARIRKEGKREGYICDTRCANRQTHSKMHRLEGNPFLGNQSGKEDFWLGLLRAREKLLS